MTGVMQEGSDSQDALSGAKPIGRIGVADE
jgi:hypothetical protein